MGIQSSIPTLERNGAVWLAGEASGDFIASLVIPEVAARMGGAPQYGVGGDKMRAAGFRAWYDSRELSVRGYVEVLTHLPRLLSFRKDLITRFGDSMPQVFVGVDAPDFNLAVEEKLRRRGVPTGFSSVPPPGPATPVVTTEASAPAALTAPSAISAAVCLETAPYFSRVSFFTPSSLCLASLE